ncbi:MAG TPA: amino acid--tRNA ligase-related protein [Patescibacteria group bacterium]|nr:amino acid--tRNA ligase-related protein [Patescibacteria group bacterium]
MKKAIELTVENKKVQLDFNTHFNNLVGFYQSLNKGAYDSYRKRGRTYVDVPEIVGITGACENVDTLFKVGNHNDIPLFFTQTGQLALEQALQSLPSVFTVIHSGRDEEIEDERHLRQFRLTEEEFDSTTIGMTRETYDEDKMYEALLVNIQETIQSMLSGILKDNEKILQTIYKRNIEKIRYAATHNFHRISYEDAVKLLNVNGYPEVSFGDDLKANHEAKIVEVLNKKDKTELPVFIMKYPKEIKFFNMKVSSKDSRVCLSADCIFPYAGEGTGASVREHDFEKLNERLITSTMFKLHIQRGGRYEDFKWYLDIMEKKGTNPHAGYGAGNDRVMQYILGEKDIRNASLFYLLNLQTGDWNKKHYGQAPIIIPEKKHILLSIGRVENKRQLLPVVKLLAKSGNAIFYATEHTHEFLKSKGVQTALVHKISEVGETPNIADLLNKKVFDVIIDIPTRKLFKESKEFTDGKLIRKGAIKTGAGLITDVEVAQIVMSNLSENHTNLISEKSNGKSLSNHSGRLVDANVGL